MPKKSIRASFWKWILPPQSPPALVTITKETLDKVGACAGSPPQPISISVEDGSVSVFQRGGGGGGSSGRVAGAPATKAPPTPIPPRTPPRTVALKISNESASRIYAEAYSASIMRRMAPLTARLCARHAVLDYIVLMDSEYLPDLMDKPEAG